MSNIADIIRHESECGYVEFKSEQYFTNGLAAFVKDMMAMANSPFPGKKYIIVGVAEKGGNKDLAGLSQTLDDSANYHQTIHSNVEPEIPFTVRTVEVDDKSFGVFTIEGSTNRPYMMKKDYFGLKKGECYIRKGSSTERLIRRDLDEIWEERQKRETFDGDVRVSAALEDGSTAIVAISRFVVLPSQREAKKIERRMAELKSGREGKNLEVSGLRDNFYQHMEMPELTDQLGRVHITYAGEDLYEKFEKQGTKINFTLLNTGSSYVEDVSVLITLPALTGFEIAPKQYYETSALAFSYLDTNFTTQRLKYPEVKRNGDHYEIRQPLGMLPHQIPATLFVTPIRIYADHRMAGQMVSARVVVYGKNLTVPLEKQVILPFGE